MTGTAFDNQDTFNAYDYNDRSEVVGGQKYQGIDPNDKSNPVPSYDYDYNYDPIGNRQTFTDSGTQTTYTTNNLNQYTQLSSFPTQPSHDLDGNMTTMPSEDGPWTLEWNGENRLIRAEENSSPSGRGRVRVEYQYDYMGRRVRKRSYSGSAILGWTLDEDLRYIYDGWNLTLEPSTTYEPQSTTHKTYVWGLDLSQTTQGAGGVGGLLAVTEQGTTPATYDANGNVSEYLDANGSSVAYYEYSPFGRTTVATGTKAADFAHRFSTQYLGEHGLHYYGYRYYSSELGRWVSRDPWGEVVPKDHLNVYCQMHNTPVNAFDLWGLFCVSIRLPQPGRLFDTDCVADRRPVKCRNPFDLLSAISSLLNAHPAVCCLAELCTQGQNDEYAIETYVKCKWGREVLIGYVCFGPRGVTRGERWRDTGWRSRGYHYVRRIHIGHMPILQQKCPQLARALRDGAIL